MRDVLETYYVEIETLILETETLTNLAETLDTQDKTKKRRW